jgi:toxin ParE1/3/4
LGTRDAQLKYIADRNPAAAARLGDAIRAAVVLLADNPHMGRAGRVDGTRELVVARTPFVIVYRVVATEVRIIRMLHSAQRWPPMN